MFELKGEGERKGQPEKAFDWLELVHAHKCRMTLGACVHVLVHVSQRSDKSVEVKKGLRAEGS